MKRSALFLPALALAVSLVASGCGGSDSSDGSSDSTPTPSPSASALAQADFVEQANAICSDSNVAINAAGDALGSAPTDEQISAFVTDTLIPGIQAQHDAIAALGAPEGDEDTIDALLTSLQDGIDALAADPSSVTADPGPFADANAAATDYGLTECAG